MQMQDERLDKDGDGGMEREEHHKEEPWLDRKGENKVG